MNDWFHGLAAQHILPAGVVAELLDVGFVILPNAVSANDVAALADAYDAALADASDDDVRIGSTTTRLHDFVNRGPQFDGLYTFPPLVEACCRVINQPFKLSSMLARTLHSHTPAQDLHADYAPDGEGEGWPMVGFIVMVDAFHADNGATRFVPGSHRLAVSAEQALFDPTADHPDQQLACGPAGSMIIYNGSTWHGHTANQTDGPRRSIQGAFIRRDAQAAVDQRAQLRPQTRARISDLALYLLDA